MRASGDPYLLHCVETAELLAKIGANATIVAAGLLHDTLDDSFVNYDYIFRIFGAGVADLVEGVRLISISFFSCNTKFWMVFKLIFAIFFFTVICVGIVEALL